MDPLDTPDKDLPLRDDIRLLDRIPGATIRSQEGEPDVAIVDQSPLHLDPLPSPGERSRATRARGDIKRSLRPNC